MKSVLFSRYRLDDFYDEMVVGKGDIRSWYQSFTDSLINLGFTEVVQRQRAAEKAFMSMGVTFNVYSDGSGTEKIFPFDIIPRIIDTKEWEKIETGLQQRIKAINFFIHDIYGPKKIIKDGIIPSDVVLSSVGYLKQCEGLKPPRGIWAHVSGLIVNVPLDWKRFAEAIFRSSVCKVILLDDVTTAVPS